MDKYIKKRKLPVGSDKESKGSYMQNLLRKYITVQLKNPTGLAGRIVARYLSVRHQNIYTYLLSIIDLEEKSRVLEIGFGAGDGLQILAQDKRIATVHGLDISPLMYEMAIKNCGHYVGNGKIQLWTGDIFTFQPRFNYNCVVCANVIYFMDDLVENLKTIYSFLNPGGSIHIYIDTPQKNENLSGEVFIQRSQQQVSIALIAAGFSFIKCRENQGYYISGIKHYHYSLEISSIYDPSKSLEGKEIPFALQTNKHNSA